MDEDHGYDYDLVIRERLRKANEEFEHDQTPAELKRPQRVSFDTVVKAVDIVQPSRENDTADSFGWSFHSDDDQRIAAASCEHRQCHWQARIHRAVERYTAKARPDTHRTVEGTAILRHPVTGQVLGSVGKPASARSLE